MDRESRRAAMRDLYELCREHVEISAAYTSHAYRGFVTYDDVTQELWACVYDSNTRTGEPWEQRIRSWLEPEDPKDLKAGEWRFSRWLQRAGQRYARREKARAVGYSPEDEFFYNTGMVRELLTAMWDEDPFSTPAQDVQVRSNQDPAEGGSRAAMFADVARALDTLDGDVRLMVKLRYRDDVPISEIARLYDLTHDAARSRLDRAVRRMVKHLGGQSPYSDGSSS